MSLIYETLFYKKKIIQSLVDMCFKKLKNLSTVHA